MNAVIVDTNVLVIANGEADHASSDCIEHCRDRLEIILSRPEKVVIDDGWRILGEYDDNTKPNTRKGIGDLFVKTLMQNQGNPSICQIVHITPLAGNGTDFQEFPTDSALCGFDPDDRKFIAVTLAHQQDTGETATILLAIDRGWLQFTNALASHGVTVDLICKKDIQRPRQN
ncbi:hypothetical protein C6501_02395 [Candidatus Poribacteria bacterium]|nr:MAG: hypothetical protein C6501_02395 [Candidatus Poribacteria bacterium]